MKSAGKDEYQWWRILHLQDHQGQSLARKDHPIHKLALPLSPDLTFVVDVHALSMSICILLYTGSVYHHQLPCDNATFYQICLLLHFAIC